MSGSPIRINKYSGGVGDCDNDDDDDDDDGGDDGNIDGGGDGGDDDDGDDRSSQPTAWGSFDRTSCPRTESSTSLRT